MTTFVMCPGCARVLKYQKPEIAEKTIDKHNEQRHDGDSVARKLESVDDLNEAMDEARELLGRGDRTKLVRKVLEHSLTNEETYE